MQNHRRLYSDTRSKNAPKQTPLSILKTEILIFRRQVDVFPLNIPKALSAPSNHHLRYRIQLLGTLLTPLQQALYDKISPQMHPLLRRFPLRRQHQVPTIPAIILSLELYRLPMNPLYHSSFPS